MAAFIGEPAVVLLACFQCGTHMSEGAYESLPGKVLESMVEDRPWPGMVRPLPGSCSVGPRQDARPAGQPYLEPVRSIVRCCL